MISRKIGQPLMRRLALDCRSVRRRLLATPRLCRAGRRRAHDRSHRRRRAASGRDGAARRARGWSRPANTPTTWSPTTNVKWRVPVPGAGNSSPIVWGDRIYLTTAHDGGARLSLIAFNRADGKQVVGDVPATGGVEHGAPEERTRLGDAGHRWPAGLRVVRAATVSSPSTVDGKTRVAPQVRRHRQLSRPGGIAGALQGSHLSVPGSRRIGRAASVRRRVRREDRQDVVGDAADAKPSAGARRSSSTPATATS